MVMELAVELPTYQRSDLYAYNTNIIDASTLTPAAELTPFNGPINKIWEIGLNEGKSASGSNGTVIIIVVVALVVVAGAGVGVFFVMKSKKAKAAAAEKAFLGNVTNATAEASSQENAIEENKEDSPKEEGTDQTPEDGE